MAETVTYVNRSNLATFLAKIKELIPSSLTFLTKTEAEETYQEKLKYYTEDASAQAAGMQVTYDDGKTAGVAIGETGAGIASLGIPIQFATSNADIFLTPIGGDIRLTPNSNHKAYYNSSEILSEASVVDSLESTSATAPLSANQGKVLNEKFDDILTKSDVMTNTDVAMLSRMFALPLSSYVGAGLYQPSTNTISKYAEMFDSLNDDELVVCEYQGVKGLYKYQGGTQLYCFTQWVADLQNNPIVTTATGVTSTAIRNVQYVSALPSSPSSDTLYLIPE